MGPFSDNWTKEDVEEVLNRGDPEELLYVPVVITMFCADCEWAAHICAKLASHADALVRGNALLGFGYLAKWCTHVFPQDSIGLVLNGLTDSEDWVRKQASIAVEEIAIHRPDVLRGEDG